MAYNHEYPYVDPNRYNSDWILNKIKELEGEMDTFEALNKITFSGEWDITKQYPAWTIVNDNNGRDGYISIQPVPKGVTIDNIDYWRGVANYSDIIADLQNRMIQAEQDIDGLQNRMGQAEQDIDVLETESHSVLEGRRFVIITDSYGEITDNFISRMKVMCPELNEGTNLFSFAYGACGFVSSGTDYTWYKRFITNGDIGTVTDPSTITDVFVLGGSNDRSASITIADIMAAGSTFYTALKAVFTNAVIYCGYIGYSVNPLAGEYAPQVKQAYQDMLLYGYRPISDSNSWLHFTGYIADNVHPTLAGSNRIAAGVLNTMLGGCTSDVFNNRPTNLTITPASGMTIHSSTYLRGWHYGSVSGIHAEPSGHLRVSGTFSANTNWITIGTIDDSFLYGANGTPTVYPTFFYGYINGNDRCLAAKVRIKNYKLEVCIYPERDITNPFTVTDAQIGIPPMIMPDIFM